MHEKFKDLVQIIFWAFLVPNQDFKKVKFQKGPYKKKLKKSNFQKKFLDIF